MHHASFEMDVLGWQVYKPFFSPDQVTEDQLEPYRNSDLLGFADITTDLTPPDPLIHFFSSTGPVNIDDVEKPFEANHALLTEFAIHKRLDSGIPLMNVIVFTERSWRPPFVPEWPICRRTSGIQRPPVDRVAD